MKIFNFIKKYIFIAVFIMLFAGITNEVNSWPRFGVVFAPAPVEVVTVRPGPNFVWIKGHYRTGRWGYLSWVPGHWKRI